MELRAYKPGDLEAIFALDVACFAPRFRFSRGFLRQLVSARGAVALLACEPEASGTEQVLGFCIANVRWLGEVGSGYLATLDVAPSRRHQGVGRALLEAVEAELARAGVSRVGLHVWVDNVAALRLYAAMGYRREERELAFYGTGADAWRLGKPLNEGQRSEPAIGVFGEGSEGSDTRAS